MHHPIRSALFACALFAASSTLDAAIYPTITGAGSVVGSPSVTSYTANVVRRYDINGNLMLQSITTANVGTTTPGRAVATAQAAAIADGHTELWRLNSNSAEADPNATGAIRITLDQPYLLNRIAHYYHNGQYVPDRYASPTPASAA
jgi:hypothetical protein